MVAEHVDDSWQQLLANMFMQVVNQARGITIKAFQELQLQLPLLLVTTFYFLAR